MATLRYKFATPFIPQGNEKVSKLTITFDKPLDYLEVSAFINGKNAMLTTEISEKGEGVKMPNPESILDKITRIRVLSDGIMEMFTPGIEPVEPEEKSPLLDAIDKVCDKDAAERAREVLS